MEGRSLRPLLEQPNQEWPYGVVTTHGRDSHCVTTERWKYIKYFDDSEELYDRGNDTYEWINLATEESHSEIKQELKNWLPDINVPNAPGSTLAAYFSTDYPDLQKWRKNKAKWKEERGEITEAIELYLDTIQLEEQSPLWVYRRLGNLLIKDNQIDKAIKVLEKATSVHTDNPGIPKLYILLGRAYDKNNQSKKTIDNFQKAISLDPKQPQWIYKKISSIKDQELAVSANA